MRVRKRLNSFVLCGILAPRGVAFRHGSWHEERVEAEAEAEAEA